MNGLTILQNLYGIDDSFSKFQWWCDLASRKSVRISIKVALYSKEAYNISIEFILPLSSQYIINGNIKAYIIISLNYLINRSIIISCKRMTKSSKIIQNNLNQLLLWLSLLYFYKHFHNHVRLWEIKGGWVRK